jgi:hypothetical protein
VTTFRGTALNYAASAGKQQPQCSVWLSAVARGNGADSACRRGACDLRAADKAAKPSAGRAAKQRPSTRHFSYCALRGACVARAAHAAGRERHAVLLRSGSLASSGRVADIAHCCYSLQRTARLPIVRLTGRGPRAAAVPARRLVPHTRARAAVAHAAAEATVARPRPGRLHGQLMSGSSMRKTPGSASGATNVAYTVAGWAVRLRASCDSSPDSTKTEPFGEPAP